MRQPRFRPEIMQQIRGLQRLDNWHGPLEAAWHWLVIAGAIAISLIAWRALSPVAAIAVYLLALVVIGGRQRGLSGLVHQASHGTFMSSRAGNTAIAVLFGGYPVLQSFSGYVQSHVALHHGRFGSPLDPDLAYFEQAGLYREAQDSSAVRRFLIGLFSPVAVLRYALFVIRHRIWTEGEGTSEKVGRLLYLGLAAGLITWLGIWPHVLAYWFLPLVTAQIWIGAMSELAEHYPLMMDPDMNLIRMSRNRDFGALWRLLIGEHRGEGYHLVHHLFPRLPIWNLHRAHKILLADADYARLPFARSPREVLQQMELAA